MELNKTRDTDKQILAPRTSIKPSKTVPYLLLLGTVVALATGQELGSKSENDNTCANQTSTPGYVGELAFFNIPVEDTDINALPLRSREFITNPPPQQRDIASIYLMQDDETQLMFKIKVNTSTHIIEFIRNKEGQIVRVGIKLSSGAYYTNSTNGCLCDICLRHHLHSGTSAASLTLALRYQLAMFLSDIDVNAPGVLAQKYGIFDA